MGFFDFFTGEQPPLVEQALRHVTVMLENGHEMFAAASAHLLDNEILDVDLTVLDGEINQREQHLRRAVLEHLNVAPQRDLVFSLKLISIVHEAERIGDLSKSLSRTADLAHKPRMGPVVEPLRGYRDRILGLFEAVQDSFVEGNETVARRQMRTHEGIKDDLTRYVQFLADHPDLTSNEGVIYSMAARMMSRVSSHLANVASTVVFPFDQIRRSATWIGEGAA